jgi:serine/threonine-protein kinase HipA
VLFEYDATFCDRARRETLDLSPIHLGTGIESAQTAAWAPFEGAWGLFADSLPDEWGRRLVDRGLQRHGIALSDVTQLMRLAIVGDGGWGALVYRPAQALELRRRGHVDLDAIAHEARSVYIDDGSGAASGKASALLPTLIAAGGSSGGARPKIHVDVRTVDGELTDDIRYAPLSTARPSGDYVPFIIKIPTRRDRTHAGTVEYAYAAMARAAGIDVPGTRLFVAASGQRLFGVERFDRGPGGVRRHVHTLGRLLQIPQTDFSSCDYAGFLAVTHRITRHYRWKLEAFRRMVFNILAHNRDDHVQNFAYRMAADGAWELAPAYDLTFMEGPNGQHSLLVAGEGATPTRANIERVAADASLKPADVEHVIDVVSDAVAQWPEFAKAAGVPRPLARDIAERLVAIGRRTR